MFLLKFTWFEFSLLLKDKAAAVWTFLFPIVLLLVLVPLYGNFDVKRENAVELTIDACGTELELDALSKALGSAFSGTLTFNKHSDAFFESSNYRIDLNDECSLDGQLSNQAKLGLSRYHANASNDAFLALFLEKWRSLDSASDVNVLHVEDLSVKARRMPSIYFLVSGILVITLTSTSLFGVASAIVSMRAVNVFKKYRMFPISSMQLVGSLLFSRLLLMLLFSVFFIVFSFVYHDIPISITSVLKIIPVLVIGILCFISISVVLSNLFSSPSTISPVVSVLYLFSMFFGNIFIPTDMFPEWAVNISQYYPVRTFADAFRAAAFNVELGLSYAQTLLVLGAWLCISAPFAVFNFQWHGYTKN